MAATTLPERRFGASSLLLLLLFHCCILQTTYALSTPVAPQQNRGSSSSPVQKQRVGVLGCGGVLGATLFGFLQRAGSLYGTGLSNRPIAMGATSVASTCLNKILSKQFVLAFASEDQVRLCNMQDSTHIAGRLSNMDAVVCSTLYTLEERPITGNTYGRTPNDKTYEFYMDKPRAGVFGVGCEDDAVHETILTNTIEACRQANTMKHVVVIEAPGTPLSLQETCAKLLDSSRLPFTYVRIQGKLESFPDYTYIKGVQGELALDSFTLAGDYAAASGYQPGDWMQDFNEDSSGGGSSAVYREDVAALVVQCLQSLDWSTSRCMVVSNTISKEQETQKWPIRGRHDREWCVNSQVLADKLVSVQ